MNEPEGGAHIAALDAFVQVLASVPEGPSPRSDDDGRAFYSGLCEAICQLTSAQRALIFRYDSTRRQVRAAGAHGIDVEIFDDGFFTVETLSAARQALASDAVVEIPPHDAIPSQYASLVGDVGGLVVTPMAAGGRWVGIIISDRLSSATPLPAAESHMLWTLGKTAALATTARISTHQAQRARELEARIDMARDIHDGAIQRLFGVSLALSGDGPLDAESRARCADELQLAMQDLRNALQRPLGRTSRPTNTTLGEELTRLAAEHAESGIVLERGDPAAVPPDLEPLVQSVLVEAVRNAHRHATPTAVRVSVTDAADAFVLEIRNDGVTHNPGPSGVGLRLAAVEALQLGGLLEFGQPSPNEWQVRLVVPHHG